MTLRCQAAVEKRDGLRHRKGIGFRMSYRTEQCARPADMAMPAVGTCFCWQHHAGLSRGTTRQHTSFPRATMEEA